ncbi:MAG TPA: hypothetical protein VIM69_03430 [Opitutaceae bacterium]
MQRRTKGAAPAKTVSRSERWARAVALFFAGATSGIDLHIVGTLPVGEIVILAAFAVFQFQAWSSRGEPRARYFNWLLSLQAIATCALIFSDFYRGSESADYLRGWMRMVLLLIDLLAFSVIESRAVGVWVAFQVGTVFSCVSLLTAPPLFGEYWKFGFASSVTVLVVLILQRINVTAVRMIGLLGLGAVHAVLEYRSMAMICGCTALALAMAQVPKKYRFKTAIVFAVISALAFFPLRTLVLQKKGDGGSRSDVERAAMIEAASGAFVDSPFIGQGSWFSHSDVMNRFLDIRAMREADAGGGLGFDPNDAEGVAIHSQTLVALAEGGLFGGGFFLFYDLLVGWAILARIFVLGEDRGGSPLEFYVLFSSLYASFMSPFSGIERLHIALAAVLAVEVVMRARRQREANPKPKMRNAPPTYQLS